MRIAVVTIGLAVLAATVGGCGGSSSRSSSTSGTSTSATVTSSSATSTTPSPPPPTVLNSANCSPPAQHPYPIVLLPGTYGVSTWQLIGPRLASLGYCVSTFTYGNSETGDIPTSARQLAGDVDQLLARTGAKRVSIVGHSEGGMMPRYYIKLLGGAAKVQSLVGLAPSNHGTLNPASFGGALTGCVACGQQLTGSPFMTQLNAGDETPPPVNYTVIETMYDEVVVPYTSAFLNGPATRVTNVTLQRQCRADVIGHIGITSDPVALQWVENALSRNSGPADAGFVPTC